MLRRSPWIRGLVGSFLFLVTAAGSQAQTPQAPLPAAPLPAGTTPAAGQPAVDSRADEKLAYFRERIAACRLAVADRSNEPCQFVAEPLIKFDNPISFIEDGFMFLWTDRGRPAAVVKSYHNLPNKTWGRTFVSIATRPIEMQVGEKKLWTPQAAGISFAALPGSPPPAEQPRQRLPQMREIAKRFQVVDRWGIKDPTDWQLRLLTAPLYRYVVADEGVVDGALFGYALTTAPEALLLLEVRKTASGLAWQYAVSRCTRFEIRISLDGQPIAEFPRLEAWPPTQTYFHDPIPLADYPFPTRIPAAAEK
jgi:hypothetical protein